MRNALRRTEATSLVGLCRCIKPQVLRSQPDLGANSLILLCESQHRRLDAAGAPFHSFAMNWDTHNSDRQKSTSFEPSVQYLNNSSHVQNLSSTLGPAELIVQYSVHCNCTANEYTEKSRMHCPILMLLLVTKRNKRFSSRLKKMWIYYNKEIAYRISWH